MPSGSPVFSRPDCDTVELNLFGRGQGECLAIHSDGHWIAVDSCLGRDGKTPAHLEYFQRIGVAPSQVSHIVCSHYDKDHVVGLPRLLTYAPSATVIVPTAMSERDFLRYAALHSGAGPGRRNPAIYEFFDTVDKQDRRLLRAHARTVHTIAGGSMTALAPSDTEIDLFLKWVVSQIPSLAAGFSGASGPSNNSISMVLLLQTEKHALLLGGDCLSLVDIDRGWLAALVHLRNTPVSAYKVAHHGGASGDCPAVWSKHLTNNSVVCLAPYNGGGNPVPSEADIDRIKARAVPAFCASTVRRITGFSHAYSKATQRLAERMSGKRVTSTLKTFGQIRFRWKPGAEQPEVALFGDALAL